MANTIAKKGEVKALKGVCSELGPVFFEPGLFERFGQESVEICLERQARVVQDELDSLARISGNFDARKGLFVETVHPNSNGDQLVVLTIFDEPVTFTAVLASSDPLTQVRVLQ